MSVQYAFIPLAEGVADARRAAERALALDSSLSDAFTSYGELLFLQRQWDGAEDAYRRAIAANPGNANAHHFFGWFLSHLGRHEEALAELERARELDPFSPIINTDLGGALYVARRYTDAERHLVRARELDPRFRRTLWILALVQYELGRVDEAVNTMGMRIGLADLWNAQYAALLVKAGQRAEGIEQLNSFLARSRGIPGTPGPWNSPFDAIMVPDVYLALGDVDTALEWLERAVELGLGAGPISLLVWPTYDSLRDEPRFQALVRRMGFPSEVAR